MKSISSWLFKTEPFLCECLLNGKHFALSFPLSLCPFFPVSLLFSSISSWTTSKHTNSHTAHGHGDIDGNKNSLLNCQYFISAPCGQAAVMYDGLLMWRRLGNISLAGERLWFIIPQGLITGQANRQGKGKICDLRASTSQLFIHTSRPGVHFVLQWARRDFLLIYNMTAFLQLLLVCK